jgi:hypothetical protein
MGSAAILAAGCGGSDEGTAATDSHGYTVQAVTTVSPNKLTKAEYIARANQICRQGWHIVLQNFAEYSGWQSPKMTREEVFTKSVRLSFLAGLDFHIFDRLHQLGSPKHEEHRVETVIGAMQLAVELGQVKVLIRSVPQLNSQFADYNRRAHRYGLNRCLVDGARLRKVQA